MTVVLGLSVISAVYYVGGMFMPNVGQWIVCWYVAGLAAYTAHQEWKADHGS